MMSGPEQQGHEPEQQEQQPQAPETPERPLDEVTREHEQRREKQDERDQQEQAEHKDEEESAEQMLENEMMRETYEGMRDGLTGDAKEIFAAVDAELTDQEKIDMARIFSDFMDVSDREFAAVAEKTRNVPKDEYLAEARSRRGEMISACFQNSIDDIMRVTQGAEEGAPKNDRQRLARATNERANEEFAKQMPPEGRAVLRKAKGIMVAYIEKAKAENPSRVFRGKVWEEQGGDTDADFQQNARIDRAADIYEAFNLVEEVRQANDLGLDAKVLDATGRELTDPLEISKTPHVRLEVGVAKGASAEAVKDAMGSSVILVSGDAKSQLFEGEIWRMEQGLEQVNSLIKNGKK